jgi:hypothetical protein
MELNNGFNLAGCFFLTGLYLDGNKCPQLFNHPVATNSVLGIATPDRKENPI